MKGRAVVLLWTAWLIAWCTVGSARAETPVPAAREQLREVMRDPLFDRWQLRQERATADAAAPSAWRDALREELRRWGDWLESWFRSRRPTPSPGGAGGGWFAGSAGALWSAIGWVLGGLAVLLILAFVVLWVRSAPPRAQAATGVAIDRALREGDALAAGSDAWVEQAVRLAQGGDHRMAFRAMYLALLSGLHSAGVIRYRRQQTNWAYVQSFDGPAARRELFVELTGRFDEVWYGLREPDDASFERLRGQVDTLLRWAPS